MWSLDLQSRTRNALSNIEFAYVMDDLTIPLKKFAKSPTTFGAVHINDISVRNYLVKSRLDETVWQYNTLNELIEDGWAID